MSMSSFTLWSDEDRVKINVSFNKDRMTFFSFCEAIQVYFPSHAYLCKAKKIKVCLPFLPENLQGR